MKRLIVAFTKDWDDVPTCTTHILREMGKTMPVLWIESIGMRRPSLGAPRDAKRIIRRIRSLFKRAELKENNLRVLTPVLIPKAESGIGRWLNRRVMSWRIGRELREMGYFYRKDEKDGKKDCINTSAEQKHLRNGLHQEVNPDTSTLPYPDTSSRDDERTLVEYWCFVPNAVDLLPRASDYVKVVYYCVDDWSEFHNLDTEWIAKKEKELLGRADVVFAASRFLERKLKEMFLQEGREGREELTTKHTEYTKVAESHDDESSLDSCNVGQKEKGKKQKTESGKLKFEENLESRIPPNNSATQQLNSDSSVGRIHYMSHGVEHAKFAKALTPASASDSDTPLLPYPHTSSSPLIGFYGNIYPWIDFNLLEELVKQRPAWSFVMIGQIYCDISRFEQYDNIQFIGRREHDELPDCCRSFDVAIIPYDPDNPRMKSVNPIKTKEILAAGVPVVGVNIEELRNFGDDVLTPGGGVARQSRKEKSFSQEGRKGREELVDDWIKAIEKQILRTDRKEISERMKEHDWPEVVKNIRKIVEQE